MNERHRLPNRRAHVTVAFECFDQRFKIGIGQPLDASEPYGWRGPLMVNGDRPLGPVQEIFINAQKPNSSIDCLASDGAIMFSLLLQYGCPIDTIAHAMKRNPDGSPASPFGFAADLVREQNAPLEHVLNKVAAEMATEEV